jgi:heat-inducible transcriptional repressor
VNTFLQGLDLGEINLPVITQMKEQAGEYRHLVNDVLDAIMQAVTEEEDIEIFTSGATNMLRYPELSDKDKVSEILYTLEEKKALTELIQDKIDDEENRGIQVYIGDETSVEAMKECSVVTATYEIEEGVYGKVGIIGPKRMDYQRVVSTLQSLMIQLDDIFKKKT